MGTVLKAELTSIDMFYVRSRKLSKATDSTVFRFWVNFAARRIVPGLTSQILGR